MHIEDTSDTDNIIFNDTMDALGLMQHVKSPTHKQGNILDLIFSKVNGQLRISNCQVENYISDHAIITIETNIIKRKPPLTTKLIRDKLKLTKENMLSNFKEPTIEDHLGLSHTYDQFTTALQNMVDDTTPLKETKSVDKQHKPYNNKYIRNQQKIVKTRERTWINTENNTSDRLPKRKKYLQHIVKVSQEAMCYPSSTRKQQKHKRPLQAYK